MLLIYMSKTLNYMHYITYHERYYEQIKVYSLKYTNCALRL